MHSPRQRTLNAGGRLLSLETPLVMGILNATPDSFFAGSRAQTEADLRRRARQLLDEGADIIDVGAYSTRPGADDVSPEEEMRRLRLALTAVRAEAPDAVISVDTFRADCAQMSVEECGAQIINDISAGDLDPAMHATVARLGVPYIIMHMQGTPRDMQVDPHYDDVTTDVLAYLSVRVDRLRQMGVCDIIVDPGFGFGKTVAHNYQLLRQLPEFGIFGLPVLVGVSRKSMICRPLGIGPQEALNGTTVVNTIALLGGADILRVHDVRAAREAVTIVGLLNNGQSKANSQPMG